MFNITRRIINHKEHMNWKGGGDTTGMSNLDPQVKDRLLPVMDRFISNWEGGDYGKVAGLDPITKTALGEAEESLTEGGLHSVSGMGTESLNFMSDVLSGQYDIDSAGVLSAMQSKQAEDAARRGAVTAGMNSQAGSGRAEATRMRQAAIDTNMLADKQFEIDRYNRELRGKASEGLISGVGQVYDQMGKPLEDRVTIGGIFEGAKQKGLDAKLKADQAISGLASIGSGTPMSMSYKQGK